MTYTAYYVLLALELATLLLLVIEGVVKFGRLEAQEEQETKEFEQRIAARQAANANAPAIPGNTTTQGASS